MDALEPSPLPYETPRESPRVRIERFADGGVTATLRPTDRDFYIGLGPWLCVALGGAATTVMLASLAPTLQTPIFVIGGGFVAVAMFFMAFHVTRTGQPIVIGVSLKGVYIDYPKWLVRRRRHFRREETGDVGKTHARAAAERRGIVAERQPREAHVIRRRTRRSVAQEPAAR